MIQVNKWQKVISDGSHDFDNPKAYGDTFIFDGLVQINAAHVTDACLVLDATDHMKLTYWQKGGNCPDHQYQYLELKLTNKESLTRVH